MTAFLFAVSVVLIGIGITGVILRRNPLIMLMCVELILNAANLMLVTVDRLSDAFDGQILALFIIAIGAAEVSVGLALVVRVFHSEPVADVDEYHELSG